MPPKNQHAIIHGAGAKPNAHKAALGLSWFEPQRAPQSGGRGLGAGQEVRQGGTRVEVEANGVLPPVHYTLFSLCMLQQIDLL